MKNRLIALAALGLTAAGCADNKSSLQIQSICFPAAECEPISECEVAFAGVPMVASGEDLVLEFQVTNQLENNADPAAGRVNTNDAHVTGAIYESSGGVSGTVEFVSGNIWVPAEGTTVVSLGFPTSAVTGTLPMLADGVLRLTGYYENGREFETGDFTLPILIVAATDLTACPTGEVVTCPPYPGATAARVQYPSACAAP